MTRTWLVSLLSDQMVPNILLARQLMRDGVEIDRHLLVSTQIMEQRRKGEIYRDLVGVAEEDVNILEVDHKGVGSVFGKLGDMAFSEEDHFLVNLTGGTKMMSMGAFKWFSTRNHVLFYYLPMGSPDAYRLDNQTVERKEKLPITVRLSVKEYLNSYGVSIISENIPDPPLVDWMNNNLPLLWEVSKDRESAVMAELGRMRDDVSQLKKKSLPLEKSGELTSWLDKRAFPLSRKDENRITKEEIKFLTGDWLEVLVAGQVRDAHPDLAKDEIMCGVQIQRDDANNELDVIYMLNNAPRVIECKTLLEREYFDDTVYKLSTLRNSFGLTAKSAIVALHLGQNLLEKDRSRIRDTRLDRLKSLSIRFVHTPSPDMVSLRQHIANWKK